ncbi:MAG: hypothetical protein WD529_00480 [Balneolaceae bacterium]
MSEHSTEHSGLQKIHLHIQTLAGELFRLKDENQELKEEAERLRSELGHKKKRIESLNREQDPSFSRTERVLLKQQVDILLKKLDSHLGEEES